MLQEDISAISQRTDESFISDRQRRAQHCAQCQADIENINTEQETTTVSEDKNLLQNILTNE